MAEAEAGPESRSAVADPYFAPLADGEEPKAVGTLFLTMIILMVIVGIWAIVYLELLGR